MKWKIQRNICDRCLLPWTNGVTMKIAYCLETTALWGGINVVFDQAEGLAARGYELEIIVRELVPPWRNTPCHIHTLSTKWEQHDFSSFDVIIATHCSQVLALAGKEAQLVHLVQGDDEACSLTEAEKDLAQRALRLPVPKIAISPELARRLSCRYSGALGLDSTVNRLFPLEAGTAFARKESFVAGRTF